jgi:ribosomal protein L32
MATTQRKPTRKKRPERRRHPRRQAALGTVCRFGDDSALGELGLVWNLSTSGVSVLAHRACAAGARVQGMLTTIDAAVTLPVAFEVAHVKELGTGDFVVAGPFLHKLAAAKLKPFIAAS